MANQDAQTTTTPPKKKRRWLRRFLWLFGSLLMLPIVILVLFLALWQVGPSRALVRSIGLSVASGFLHGKLELDSLGGTLLTGLEVKGVRWYSRKGKLIAGLKRLDVRYDLMHFLKKGELLVSSVVLEKPEGYLFVQKDGQINLLAHLNLGPPPKDPPKKPKVDLSCQPKTFKTGGFTIVVPKITVRGITFAWGEGEKALRVEGLDIDTDFKMIGSTMMAALKDLHLNLRNPEVKVRKLSLGFKMETICDAKTKMQVTQIRANQVDLDFGDRSMLYLDAFIKDLSTLDMEVKARKFFVATADIKRIVPVYPVKPDIEADTFTASGTLADLTAALRLKIGQMQIGLKARAGILNQKYDVKLNVDRADASEIMGNPSLSSDLSLELTAKGKGFSDKTRGNVHLQVKPGRFQQFQIQEVSVLVNAADGAFVIPALRVRTPYATIPRGQAYVKLDGGIVRADISGRIANLSKLGRVIKQKLGGSVSFRLKASGKKFLPQATIVLDGKDISHPAARVGKLHLNAELQDLTPVTARVKALSVRNVQAGGQTVYRADIGLRYKMGKGKTGPAHIVHFEQLQFDVGTGLFKLRRAKNKTVLVSFQDDRAVVRNFWLQNDRNDAKRRLRRSLAITRRGMLRAPSQETTKLPTSTYRRNLKRLADSRSIPRTCRRYYRQQYNDLRDIEAKYKAWTKAQERAKKRRSKRKKKGKKPTPPPTLAKSYTLESCRSILEQEVQSLQHTISACSIPQAESIKIMDASFHVKGAGQKLGLQIQHLAVGCLTGVLGIMRGTPLKGALNVDVRLGGDFRRPRLDLLKVNLEDGRFDKFRDLGLDLTARYNPKGVPRSLRDIFQLDLSAGYKEQRFARQGGAFKIQKVVRKLLSVETNIPIRAAIQGMPRQPIQFQRKLNRPILRLQLPKISLDWLARILNQGDMTRGKKPGNLRLGGTVLADIRVDGPLSVPTLDVRFSMDKGRYEQLRDIDVKLNVRFRDGDLRLEENENRIRIGNKPILEMGGKLPLHVRLSPPKSSRKRKKTSNQLYWLDDTDLRFFLKIHKQKVQDWQDFLPASLKEALRGVLSADILLAGRPSSPSFKFGVDFKDGSFCPLVSRTVSLTAKERRSLLWDAQSQEKKRVAQLRKKGKKEKPKKITLDDIPFTKSVSEFTCSQKMRSLVSKTKKVKSLRTKGISFHFGVRYLPPGQSKQISPQCPTASGCLSFSSKLHVRADKSNKNTSQQDETYFLLPEKSNWIAMDIKVHPKTLQPAIRIFDHVSLDVRVPGLPLRDLYRFARVPALLKLKKGSRFVLYFREKGTLSKPTLSVKARLKNVGYEMGRDVDDKPLYLDGVNTNIDVALKPGNANVLAQVRVFDRPLLTNYTRYDIQVGMDLAQLNQKLPGNPRPKRRSAQGAMVRVEPGRFFSNRLTFHNFKLENFAALGGVYNKLGGTLSGAILLEGDPACPEWKAISRAKPGLPARESHIELTNGVIGDRGSPKARSKEFVATIKARAAFDKIAKLWRQTTTEDTSITKKINELRKKPNISTAEKGQLRQLLAERRSFRRRKYYPITARYNHARQVLLSFTRGKKKALKFSHFYIGLFSTTDDNQQQRDGRTRVLLKMVQNGQWKVERGKRIMRGFDILDGQILAALPLALATLQNKQEYQQRCPALKNGKADDRLYVKLGVIGERMKLDFIEAFAPGIELQGEPKLIVNLSGTLQSPQIKSGQVGVEISKMKYNAYGVEIGEQKDKMRHFSKPKRSKFVIQLKPTRYQVICRLYGKSGTPFQIDGWISHKNFVPTDMNLKIHSKEFKPMDTLRHRATLQANISVTEALDAPKVRGSLTIPEFLFTLPESSRSPQSYAEDEDIYVLGEPNKKRKRKEALDDRPPPTGITQKMLLDLKIIIPRNFFVKNRDLSIEAKTEDFRPLGINLQRGRLKLTGGVQIRRGELAVYGKKFLVQTGSAVAFTGQSLGMDELGYIDPKLNVIAVYIVKVQSGTSLAKQGYKRVKVLLKALGSAQNPRIEFEVRDVDTDAKLAIDRINVISLILTGTTTEDLSRGQQDNLTKQAVGMVGSMVASELKNALSGVVKMDVLNIETGANVSDLKVEAGWYLTPDLYLEVAVKPAPLEEESYLDMRLDYAINRNLSLELRSGLVKRNDALWFRGSGHFFVKGKFLCLWPFCPKAAPPKKKK
ncbi:MAG: translocation/assembly module TamB [Myxococcales bacterium]|nr:translocation/assembly module TamB [Myxococcales bacterium]